MRCPNATEVVGDVPVVGARRVGHVFAALDILRLRRRHWHCPSQGRFAGARPSIAAWAVRLPRAPRSPPPRPLVRRGADDSRGARSSLGPGARARSAPCECACLRRGPAPTKRGCSGPSQPATDIPRDAGPCKSFRALKWWPARSLASRRPLRPPPPPRFRILRSSIAPGKGRATHSAREWLLP